MANLSDSILGPVRRRRRATAPPTREAKTPAPASALTPAPERRAEPEAPPAKRKPEAKREANTIKAIVIDPAARIVKEVKLATEPGNTRNGFGTQVKQDALVDIIGTADIDWIDLGNGAALGVDALRQGQGEGMEWTLGNDGEPIAGKGVIVSYDPKADEYADVRLSLDEAREAVKWAGDAEDADPDELRAEISERLNGLDGAQIKKLRALLDGGALDAAEGEAEVRAAPTQQAY